VKSQAAQLEKLAARLSELQRQYDPFVKASDLRALEHGRFSHQIGALEHRLGAVEQRLADGALTADDTSLAEARSVVDAVRREHEQIRVRMQIISAYEERLRRVEETAAHLYQGDLRHQV
jgi:hypothetical protein